MLGSDELTEKELEMIIPHEHFSLKPHKEQIIRLIGEESTHYVDIFKALVHRKGGTLYNPHNGEPTSFFALWKDFERDTLPFIEITGKNEPERICLTYFLLTKETGFCFSDEEQALIKNGWQIIKRRVEELGEPNNRYIPIELNNNIFDFFSDPSYVDTLIDGEKEYPLEAYIHNAPWAEHREHLHKAFDYYVGRHGRNMPTTHLHWTIEIISIQKYESDTEQKLLKPFTKIHEIWGESKQAFAHREKFLMECLNAYNDYDSGKRHVFEWYGDRFCRALVLFDIPRELASELVDSRKPPEKVRILFEDAGFPLSPKARIRHKKECKWILSDGQETYFIVKHNRELLVHNGVYFEIEY